MNGHAILRMAEAMAEICHEGQCRKGAGEPYVYHLRRVADQLKGWKLKTVAFLHDVVEDTDVSLENLIPFFPTDIIVAVDAMTKMNGEDYQDYLIRVKENILARQVKIADLNDNLHDIDELPVNYTKMKAKYNTALSFLGED